MGSLLLYHGEFRESLAYLQDYVVDHQFDRIAWFQIAKAYYGMGNLVEAGNAYEKAGILKALEQPTSPLSIYVRTAQSSIEAKEVEVIALAMARESERLQKSSEAARYARLARMWSNDSGVIAETLHVESAAELLAGNYKPSIVAARRSMDISCPHGRADERFRLLCQAATNLAQENACQGPQESESLLFLLPLYCTDYVALPSTCAESIFESALTNLPSAIHPYLMLRRAMLAIRDGHCEQAGAWLETAMKHGLPPAWSVVLLSGGATLIQDNHLQPTYPLDDEELLGYEIDPVQVELGLPLDMVLFYRKGFAPASGTVPVPGADLYFYQAVNMAPDPGSEYFALDGCNPLECQPLAYSDTYSDSYVYLYNWQPDVYQVVRRARPLRPEQPESESTSTVLLLTNRHFMPYSTLWALNRPVTPETGALQAGWVRSDQGSGYILTRWTADPNGDEHTVSAYADNRWAYVSRVVQAPPDAEGVALAVSNYNAPGDVWFDGLLFVVLPADR